MNKRCIRSKAAIWSLLPMLIFLTACGPNQRILRSANNSSAAGDVEQPAADPQSRPAGIEQDIEAMRNADFNFIYVFRRRDGAPMDADDKRYFNSNTPVEINRRRLADGDRAIIVGSNYRYPPEALAAFKKRFIFEDYSKPESEIMGNSNANS